MGYAAFQAQQKKKKQEEAKKPLLYKGVQTAPNFSQANIQKPVLYQGSQQAPNFNQYKPANQSTAQGPRFAAPPSIQPKIPAPAPQSSLNASPAVRFNKPDIKTFTQNNQAVQFAKQAAQGTMRTYGAVGAVLAAGPQGIKQPGFPTFTPQGKFQQAIYGTDKPISLQTAGEEFPLVKKGSPIAPALAALSVGLDLTPGGAGGKKLARGLAAKADDILRQAKASPVLFSQIDEFVTRANKATASNQLNTMMTLFENNKPLLSKIGAANLSIDDTLAVLQRVATEDTGAAVGKVAKPATQAIDTFDDTNLTKNITAYKPNTQTTKDVLTKAGAIKEPQPRDGITQRFMSFFKDGDAPPGYSKGAIKNPFANDASRPTTSVLPEQGLKATDISPSTKLPTQATPDTNATPSSLPRSVGETFSKVKTSVLEYVQNTEERIRQLQKRPDLKIDDATDVYQKMTLMPGRISAKVEKGFDKARGIAEDIVGLAGRNKTPIKATREEVNTYLQALHAPERNKALGDGAAGMLTDDAMKITAAARKEVKEIAEKALDLNRETLNILHQAGVVSDDLVKTLTTKYKNHVPLQRVMDEADDIGEILSGAGLDVKSTGIKAAKGSSREVRDILSNIMTNYEQAVIRAEKNIVDNATLAFVRKNEDVLSDLFEIKSPRMLGTAADGRPIMQRSTDPQVLSFFENGKAREIFIKDPMLAIAFRGVGREKLGGIMRGVQAITRLYSSLATRFNPEFALPNKIRDLQETMTFLASQGDVGFKGAGKALVNDPVSIKSVTDWLRGADTPGAKLYQEMIEMGGTTGGMGLSTRKQIEINIDRLFTNARSNPRKAATKLIEYVDNFNTVFEDSTRLSVYKSALSQGLSKERAAFLAKEASINFNRMGKGGPMINALYMFSNASIQGSTKMMRAMANPKVAASIVTIMGASVAATNEWNDKVDPEWREKIPKWDRMNGLTVMLPSEEGVKYFTIPVGWGLKPILVMSNGAYDAVSGHEFDPATLTKDVLSAFLNAYNPIGGTDITSALTPTVLDMPADIRANKSWSGAPIRPTAMPGQNTPRDVQYFDSLENTFQGRKTIEATKKLQETTGIAISPADVNYAVDNIIGGAGRAVKKLFNTTVGFFSDEPLPADEYPFISRFYRERTEEETGASTAQFDEISALKSEQSRERFYRKKEAEKTHEEFKKLSPEEANARFKILKETNPLLAEKVKDIAADEKKGLTAIERSIKGLGVANGERAEYIYIQLEKLGGDKDAKNAQYKEWKEKGLISDEVAQQLKHLIKNPPKNK